MGRKATGTVYPKDGVLWFSFLLRSKKRYTQRVPPHPEGRPATEPEARTYLAEAKRRYDLGLWDPEAPKAAPAPAAPAPPTVAEYGARWAAALTHDSAFNEQMFVRKHLEGTELGSRRIDQATPLDVAAWVKDLRAKPSPRGGTLAPATVRGAFGFLKAMFTAAVFEGAAQATPCLLPKGTLPRGGDKDPAARRRWRFTREEVQALISDGGVPEPRRVLWAIAFLAGPRAGEAFAVRWRDWDATRKPLGCLAIDRAWSSRRRVEKGTKTGACREVPVHPTLAAVLAEWKLSGWGRLMGRAPGPDDLIVPTREGTARDAKNTLRDLRADCERLGIPRRRLHGTRHTFISLAIDDGARPDVISKVTHTRPQRRAFDAYRSEAWETLCHEVAKLKVSRLHGLALWRAASSGGGSATGSATPGGTQEGNAVKQATPESTPSQAARHGRESRAAESTVNQANDSGDAARIPTGSDVTGGDSATGSATPTGPHVGEMWLYDWVDRTLAAAVNEDGEIPDVEDIEP